MAEITVNADRMEQIINVFGSMDENVRIIEQEFGVSIINRDTELKITGDEENAAYAEQTIQDLLQLAAKGEAVEEQNVRYVIGLIRSTVLLILEYNVINLNFLIPVQLSVRINQLLKGWCFRTGGLENQITISVVL